jgi:deoxycytidylate deaminase
MRKREFTCLDCGLVFEKFYVSTSFKFCDKCKIEKKKAKRERVNEQKKKYAQEFKKKNPEKVRESNKKAGEVVVLKHTVFKKLPVDMILQELGYNTMARTTREEYFMEIAKAVAKAPDIETNKGIVLVRNNNIIGTGYGNDCILMAAQDCVMKNQSYKETTLYSCFELNDSEKALCEKMGLNVK